MIHTNPQETHIPAGAGEIMQYIVHEFNDNTIRFVLHYPGRLQEEALKKATLALTMSIDVLHAAFVPGRRKACWRIDEANATECFSCLNAETDVNPIALERALQPVPSDGPVQLRCTLVQGQTESAVVLLISHLCADGSDSKYLLKKLCEAYTMQLQTGSCQQLNVKNGSRDVRQIYTRLTKKEKRKLLTDPRTGIKSVFSYPTDQPGRPRVAARCISADVMAKAHQKAAHAGATVNDLLLTACYHAFADVMKTEPGAPVSIMSMMDLRRHCEDGDSQGLCNLTGALATALPLGVDADFAQTLAEIAAQTKRIKEDPLAGLYGMPLLHGAANRLPLHLLLSVSSRVYGSMAVGLTNIGALSGQSLQMGDLTPDQGWFGGPLKRKPGLQISCASFDGNCMLCIWGCAADEDVPVLQKLLDRIALHAEHFASC